MKYEIVKRNDLNMMNEIVNAKLQAGWQLQGGVSVVNRSTTLYYCQAMIKHDKVKVNQDDLQDVIKRTNKDIKEFIAKYN